MSIEIIVNTLRTVFEAVGSLGFRNILDIAIVSFLLYFALIFVKQTRSFFIFASVVVVSGIAYLSRELDLGLTRQVFQPFLTFFFLIFVIVFQREIRRFFEWFSFQGRALRMQKKISITEEVATEIAKAVAYLAKRSTGALIIIAGEHPIEYAIRGGFKTSNPVTAQLLINIFNKENHSHDGAVIIRDNKIRNIGAHLPLAESRHIGRGMGTRHRAALGITEESDALAIVVSEERGTISIAENKSLRSIANANDLTKIVADYNKEFLLPEGRTSVWYYLVFKNWLLKISAIGVAVFLWFIFVFQASIITREFTVPINFIALRPAYTIEAVSHNKATISLTGRNSDFETLTEGDIAVSLSLEYMTAGLHTLDVDAKAIKYPPYFTIENLSPDSVDIKIKEARSAETGQ